MKIASRVTAPIVLACLGGLLALQLASAQPGAQPATDTSASPAAAVQATQLRQASQPSQATQVPQSIPTEPMAASAGAGNYQRYPATQTGTNAYVPVPAMYGSQTAPRYAGYGVPTADPEVAKLHQAEVEAAREAAALAGQFNTASSDLRDEIRGQLREALARQFDAQQERRSQEIDGIEQRLAALKDTLQKRNEARDAIVDRRLNQLTGVQDELGWEETGLGPYTVGPDSAGMEFLPSAATGRRRCGARTCCPSA